MTPVDSWTRNHNRLNERGGHADGGKDKTGCISTKSPQTVWGLEQERNQRFQACLIGKMLVKVVEIKKGVCVVLKG